MSATVSHGTCNQAPKGLEIIVLKSDVYRVFLEDLLCGKTNSVPTRFAKTEMLIPH